MTPRILSSLFLFIFLLSSAEAGQLCMLNLLQIKGPCNNNSIETLCGDPGSPRNVIATHVFTESFFSTNKVNRPLFVEEHSKSSYAHAPSARTAGTLNLVGQISGGDNKTQRYFDFSVNRVRTTKGRKTSRVVVQKQRVSGNATTFADFEGIDGARLELIISCSEIMDEGHE